MLIVVICILVFHSCYDFEYELDKNFLLPLSFCMSFSLSRVYILQISNLKGNLFQSFSPSRTFRGYFSQDNFTAVMKNAGSDTLGVL